MTQTNPFDPLVDLIADRVAEKLATIQQRETKRLYSIAEAARYLSLSPAQVYRLVVGGKIKSLREGRRRLIDRDELDRWIAVRANRG
jgi:excisionase family DNA binding protein